MAQKNPVSTEEFCRIVGANIRLAREEAGLSQKALGGKVEQSDTTIRSWEKGYTSPNVGDLHKISLATKKSLAWLLDIKMPAPGGEKRAEGFEFDPTLPSGSVQVSQVPERAHRCLGYAFGPPGHEQLVVDFLVVPADERVALPVWTPRTDVD